MPPSAAGRAGAVPTSAGKGGLRRGLPCLPSMDSISAVSSPQMYAPAPRTTNTSKPYPEPHALLPSSPASYASRAATYGGDGTVGRGVPRRCRGDLPAAHLQVGGLVVELSADVDVGGAGAHGASGHQAALQQLVRVVPQDLPVLARPRFPLVRIHHQVFGPGGWALSGLPAGRPRGRGGAGAGLTCRPGVCS